MSGAVDPTRYILLLAEDDAPASMISGQKTQRVLLCGKKDSEQLYSIRAEGSLRRMAEMFDALEPEAKAVVGPTEPLSP